MSTAVETSEESRRKKVLTEMLDMFKRGPLWTPPTEAANREDAAEFRHQVGNKVVAFDRSLDGWRVCRAVVTGQGLHPNGSHWYYLDGENISYYFFPAHCVFATETEALDTAREIELIVRYTSRNYSEAIHTLITTDHRSA